MENADRQPDRPDESDTDHRNLHRRRNFLRVSGSAAVFGYGATKTAVATTDDPGPFTLGVASGDPLPDSVVLWTRLAPRPLRGDGGLGGLARPIPVTWRVATDEAMTDVVADGVAPARKRHAHSLHINVTGLEPNTEYYYQFETSSKKSPIGRTKTAPAPGTSIDEFRFAFTSCQHYPSGFYTAYRQIAQEDLDLVVQLGDYIYEGGSQGSLGRGHEPPREITSLSDYRIRHAQYKTDPDLQAAHAAFPWHVTWDDHEVENNYADEISENDDPPAEFLERRANAYKAYYEHQPLRPERMPTGPALPLYRRFRFGDLVEFNVLDTRQYRSDQVYTSEAAREPDRTILGAAQREWLVDGLENSESRWNVLAQQVPLAATDENPDPDERDFGGGDKWDGYRADRRLLLDLMTETPDLNPVVVTGDVHRNFVFDLKSDFSNPDSETVGTEFVGTSVTSFGDGSGSTLYGRNPNEPWQLFYNDNRGYVRCTITPDQWQTDYRVVSTVEDREASVRTLATFTVEDGDPGATLKYAYPRRGRTTN